MRNRFVLVSMAMVVVGVVGLPARATAWGRDGHAIVGKIADKYLSEKARAAIKELLADHEYKSLADERLPNWADAIRSSGAQEEVSRHEHVALHRRGRGRAARQAENLRLHEGRQVPWTPSSISRPS